MRGIALIGRTERPEGTKSGSWSEAPSPNIARLAGAPRRWPRGSAIARQWPFPPLTWPKTMLMRRRLAWAVTLAGTAVLMVSGCLVRRERAPVQPSSAVDFSKTALETEYPDVEAAGRVV